MRFLASWLSSSIVTCVALAGAIMAMQAPAFTREYAGALLQVAQDSRRDIEGRVASARQHYGLPEAPDAELLGRLRRVEPSNAETLAWSMERSQTFTGAYERIARSPLAFQPITAAVDAVVRDPRGYKRAVLRTLLETYAVQLDFTAAAAIYAVIGFFLGSLAARLALAIPRAALRWRSRRRPVYWRPPPRTTI